MSRREFLTAFRRKEQRSFFAPYNLKRSLFYENCVHCAEEEMVKPCVLACNAVYNKENGGVLYFNENCIEIDFSAKGCLLCGECAKFCPSDVLDKALAQEKNPNWSFTIDISISNCLAHQKILCNTCKDICYSVLGRENAIEFQGLFYPEIKESCIGCGECVSKCPVQAIFLAEKERIES